MTLAVVIIASVLALGAVLFVVFATIRARLERAAEVVRQELGGDDVVVMSEQAVFFGQASSGAGQVRGNALLVLTEDELVSHRYVPAQRLTISRARITDVSTPSTFLGKTRFKPLLCVSFTVARADGAENGEIEEDRAAWLVRDLDRWVAALEHDVD